MNTHRNFQVSWKRSLAAQGGAALLTTVLGLGLGLYPLVGQAGDTVSLRYGHGLSTYHAHQYRHYRGPKHYPKGWGKHYRRHKGFAPGHRNHRHGYRHGYRRDFYLRDRSVLGLYYRSRGGDIYFRIPLDSDYDRRRY